jgi:uridine phosphorylase
MQNARLLNSNEPIAPSELIITPQGAIYHLNLKPEQIADTIILVGDQNRVAMISDHFDTIEHEAANREFVTHTGTYRGKRLTALSTGIGCDNIDIVINELDALVNIDFETRKVKSEHTKLTMVRLGTSGALQEDIPVDTFALSRYGLGFDGLMGFYETQYEEDELAIRDAFLSQIPWHKEANKPYIVRGSDALADRIGAGMVEGITATANGFYGPQGRVLRLPVSIDGLNEALTGFSHGDQRIINFEMETSALFGLCGLLGHDASTVCAIIANRYTRTYSEDYQATVRSLITTLLARLTT